MRQSIRLGTMHGVPVGLHWSTAVILLPLTQSLAAGLLPAAAGGYATAAYWLAATGFASLFLATLLAHEYAHARTAQHYGIRVRSTPTTTGPSAASPRPRTTTTGHGAWVATRWLTEPSSRLASIVTEVAASRDRVRALLATAGNPQLALRLAAAGGTASPSTPRIAGDAFVSRQSYEAERRD